MVGDKGRILSLHLFVQQVGVPSLGDDDLRIRDLVGLGALLLGLAPTPLPAVRSSSLSSTCLLRRILLLISAQVCHGGQLLFDSLAD